MKISKITVTTALILGISISSVSNAQATTNETSSSIKQIVSLIVMNALQNTTDEIDLQLETMKVKASQLLLDANSQSTEHKQNELNDIDDPEVHRSVISKQNNNQLNQNDSDND